MAEDHRGRPQEESQYPPPPGEEDERQRAYNAPPTTMSTSVTLPSISDGYSPATRYPPPPDPRADGRARAGYSSTSPTSVNGYPAPPGPGGYLPPLQTGGGAQGSPDPRASYSADQRDYYGGAQRRPYPPSDQNYADPYHPYNGYRAPPQQPAGAAGAAGYGYQMAPPQQQAAPRQRTSIACRYCRKRKIRCSGYQNTPDGKCTNCKKTGNECVFQPVSSSSSTAFVPVSAIQGGVPPGTPLYGAFGQPLAPAGSSGTAPPYNAGPGSDYSLPSPGAPPGPGYYGPPDDRAQPGTRRPRAQDDEPGMRLPPPNPYEEEPRDPRRRSPASMQSSTPPNNYYPYRSQEYESDRTVTPGRRTSPGGSSSASSQPNVMRLDNLMDHPPPRTQAPEPGRDIDQNMLGRLNRRS